MSESSGRARSAKKEREGRSASSSETSQKKRHAETPPRKARKSSQPLLDSNSDQKGVAHSSKQATSQGVPTAQQAGSDFSCQVKALLVKYLLVLKTRYCFLVICLVFLPFLMIVMFIGNATSPQSFSWMLFEETIVLDPSTENLAYPFPSDCFPGNNESASDSAISHFMEAIYDSPKTPVNALKKKFAIGADDENLIDSLKQYMVNVEQLPMLREIYDTLNGTCSSELNYDDFMHCLRSKQSSNCASSRRLMTNSTVLAWRPKIDTSDSLNERRHLSKTSCESITDACTCAQMSQCGYQDGKCTAVASDVSCRDCSLGRLECEVKHVWEKVGQNLEALTPDIVVLRDNDEFDAKASADRSYCGGVFFGSSHLTAGSDPIRYTLRLSKKNVTWDLFVALAPKEPRLRDYKAGLRFQQMIDNFILCGENCSDTAKRSLALTAFPHAPQRGANFKYSYMISVSLFLLIIVLEFSDTLLQEKEWKVRGAMAAHGLRLSAYYTALSLFTLGLSLVVSLLYSVILTFVGDKIYTNFQTLFVLLLLCLWSGHIVVALMTTFCQKVLPHRYIILFGLFTVSFWLIFADLEPRPVRLLTALFPFANLVYASKTAGALDKSMNENNFFIAYRNFSLFDSVLVSLVGLVFWHLLFIYFDMVFHEGSVYSWYFPLSPAFWCSRSNSSGHEVRTPTSSDIRQPPTPLEASALKAHRVLDISKLTKKYGSFTAVNSIDTTIYAGEIFALLGHNGAGKSTTFGMISGMTSIDRGSISIFGQEQRHYLRQHRNKVGLCLQQNLVWPILSVNDHLRMFRSFKGISTDTRDDAAFDSILASLGLHDKRNSAASTLSGGMVRKLCLAMSLLGNPEILLLDEPTSGLDPTARREVWDLLLSLKHNRIVVLSTHYMEEADALGDRVAIMNNGRIECDGSPSFLKHKYGCGYNITCLMSSNDSDKRALHDLIAHQCGSNNVHVLADVGREVTFVLSFSTVTKFPSLFAELDRKERSHVESYSVGVSNLEEVFLKVASHETDKKGDGTMASIARKAGNMSGVGGIAAKKAAFGSQLRACLTTRLYLSRRAWGIDLLTCIFPPIFLVICAFLIPYLLGDATQSFSLAIPASDPSMLAAGTETSAAALEGNVATKSMLDSFKATEFRTTSTVADLSQVDVSEWNGNKTVPHSPPRCSTTWYPRHRANVTALASLLKSEEKSRYAAFILSENGAAPMSVMVNLGATLSPYMAINLHSNILLHDKNSKKRIRASIRNIPTPNSSSLSNFVLERILPVLLLFALSVTTLFYTSFVANESNSGIIAHQMLVGLRVAPYWIANWMVDAFTNIVAVSSALGVFFAFNFTTFVGTEFDQLSMTLVLLLLGTAANLWFIYVLFTLFKGTMATSILYTGNLSLGVTTLFIASIFDQQLTGFWLILYQVGEAIVRISPYISACLGLVDLRKKVVELRIQCHAAKSDDSACTTASVWDTMDGPVTSVIVLGIELVVFPLCVLFLTMLFRSHWWRHLFSKKVAPIAQNWKDMKDDDVRAEESRIAKMGQSGGRDDVILARNIRKVFKSSGTYVHAVQGISFATNIGEVFGLLGVNGAGKSTLFKMLIGDEVPMMGGTPYHRDPSVLKVQRGRGIGYCPQHDPLWPSLTVREHLLFTCRMQGIASNAVRQVVTDLMRALDLTAYADVRSVRLSGGNKRKLCFAMSLVGTPRILFLDEPSAGVDPLSRRFMWSAIQQIAGRDKSTTVILTTHSMEECEALCTRTAIMVNGVFRCIGANTHIRNTYGPGLTIDVSFHPVDRLKEHSTLLDQWGVDSKASVVTYKQLRPVLSSGRYPLHSALLHSKATCFSSIRNILVEDKLDVHDNVVRQTVENSVCAAMVVTEWWSSVYVCDAFIQKLRGLFENASVECEEIHGEKCRIRLIGGKTSELSAAMEKFRQNHDVEDYALCSTSLESIFNRFAREALNNKSPAPMLGCL